MVLVTAIAVGPGVFTIVVLVVNVHPFASFTITGYGPAANAVKLVVAANAPPLNEYT